MARRNRGFNTPFADAGKRLKAQAPEHPDEKARHRAEDRPPAPRDPEPADDSELFRQWVGDVAPVEGRSAVPTRSQPRPAHFHEDDDAEVVAVLSDLVAGERPFDIADTDEYVEGVAHGVDRRLLASLRRGEYSVQAHLDLHGMTREEARLAVRRFVETSRTNGLRCVLIVHGRGRNSPGREPVLKQALVRWLSRGALGKRILAFATARRHDGGGGALYVLLRR